MLESLTARQIASRVMYRDQDWADQHNVPADSDGIVRLGTMEREIATALAEAEARGRRQGLEEADDREVESILGLSDAEIIAEIEAEGRDPAALAEAMRGQMNATFKLCEEIKTLRDALAPFAAILANGEPVGPIPRGLLDSKLTRQDLRNATAAYRATTMDETRPMQVRES